MSQQPVSVTSSAHLATLLSSSTCLVADFYADWCGPCKAIAPLYAQLAGTHAAPGRVTFVKVNVDGQPDIARQYGVSAMPTFLIFRNGAVVNTLRGADPSSLRAAVASAAADAGRGPAKAGAALGGSRGQVLGGGSESGSRSGGATVAGGIGTWLNFHNSGFVGTLVRFVGLYLVTLFSLDASAAAEGSMFRVRGGAKTD